MTRSLCFDEHFLLFGEGGVLGFYRFGLYALWLRGTRPDSPRTCSSSLSDAFDSTLSRSWKLPGHRIPTRSRRSTILGYLQQTARTDAPLHHWYGTVSAAPRPHFLSSFAEQRCSCDCTRPLAGDAPVSRGQPWSLPARSIRAFCGRRSIRRFPHVSGRRPSAGCGTTRCGRISASVRITPVLGRNVDAAGAPFHADGSADRTTEHDTIGPAHGRPLFELARG